MSQLLGLEIDKDEELNLPRPKSVRWKPLRTGLLNIFRYDYQEFWLEEGRMLLRGNNGTGKSRVLALQLPFLFDGELASHRLEPDSDPAKRVSWNLLMDQYDDRCGYTFLELGRVEDGEEKFCTLGCGLRAVQGRPKVDRWFFLSPRRIGRDFFLSTEVGQPLSKERLIQALGDDGRVFTSASDYRQAINDTLFGLSQERYEALLELLIQLRQPQLSRKFEDQKISQALSRALPRIRRDVLNDLAEAFRNLETDRDALKSFQEAQAGLNDFLPQYRRYAQIAARRKAAGVRTTHSAYEKTQRDLKSSEQELEECADTLRSVEEERHTVIREQSAAAARVETLQDSPEMTDAKRLERARQDTEERNREVTGASEELRLSSERIVELQSRAIDAEAESKAASDELRAQLKKGMDIDTGLQELHGKTLPETCQPNDIDQPLERMNREAAERLQAITFMGKILDQVRQAETELSREKVVLGQRTADLDGWQDKLKEKETLLESQRGEWLESVQEWLGGLRELSLEFDLEELTLWSEEPVSQDPLTRAVAQAAEQGHAGLAEEQARLDQRCQESQTRLKELQQEERALLDGVHQPPPLPYTRTSQRDELSGAPFWELCDFKETLPEQNRAGLEAALEASGLLDAWVSSKGELVVGDTVFVGDRPVGGQSLADVMVACPGHQVAGETIERLFRSVGLGESEALAWVDTEGRFKIGPLRGAWSKASSEHVGHASREAARRRRLVEIEEFLATVQEDLELIVLEAEELRSRRQRLKSEIQEAPSAGDLLDAHRAVEQVQQAVTHTRMKVTEAEQKVAEKRNVLSNRQKERDSKSADLGLVGWLTKLDQLRDALQEYRRILAPVSSLARQASGAAERMARAEESLQEGKREKQRRAERLEKFQQHLAAAEERYRVLESTVGAAVEQILERLSQARTAVEQLRERLEILQETHADLRVQQARVEERRKAHQDQLTGHEERRSQAIDVLRAFASTGLFQVAELPQEDLQEVTPTRAVEMSRVIESRLDNVVPMDEGAWDRAQRNIHAKSQALTDRLIGWGYHPALTMESDVLLVTVPVQNEERTVTQLSQYLADEITHRQSLLSAREREVLENHLKGEISSHLHDLIHSAESMVCDMNAEIESRPTSTGMKIRFRWQTADDQPDGFEKVRKLLLRSAATWSTAERESIGNFLQQQIQSARQADESATWQENLQVAFDYRNWHRFTIERFQNGNWKRLTRRTHGTGSGGEKAIALTLPQFAAAAAHYRSTPLAPRLIMLDEAFVGVDKDMRKNCMGLVEAFDLDLVMTSEREWGCYPTLSGLAIYHLSTRPGVDAVGVTRWLWNGLVRSRTSNFSAPGTPS